MLLLKGIIVGFLIAAPVGPVNILCMKRAFTSGRFVGFISGLGAATADSFYAVVAAFGIVAISNFVTVHQFAFKSIGGVLLILIGLRSYFAKPEDLDKDGSSTGSIVSDYISTFFLTMTNPTTIISFAALMTGVGFGFANKGSLSAIILVIGVFVGSALWWFVLSTLIVWVKNKAQNLSLVLVNKIAGIAIVVIALGLLASLIR